MSDTSTSIVPNIADYHDRLSKATEIVDWLVSIRAIKPNKSDCVLSSAQGYAIDTGAKALTDEPEYLPFGLITNGLEVVTERTVFHTGENGLDSFVCPQCYEDIASEEWNFSGFSENGNSLLECPLCHNASDINDYEIEPQWGFSNLGFTFWNWADLNDDFVEEFEKRLGCEVKIVESHI